MDSKTTDLQVMMEAALKLEKQRSETPIMQLLRKILNEEREFLYSESKFNQRRRKIKVFIEDARVTGQILKDMDD